jgi:hypothetical protein
MTRTATATATATIVIRPAYADDRAVLARLAAIDSSAVPAEPMLLAEVDDELRAAVSLADGSVIADPFFPTLDLVELLRTHAAALSAGHGTWRRHRPVRRLRPHFA